MSQLPEGREKSGQINPARVGEVSVSPWLLEPPAPVRSSDLFDDLASMAQNLFPASPSQR